MLRQLILGVAPFLLLLGASHALARTWVSANGAFKIEAELLEKRSDGTIILKRADGTNIETKLEKLSKADQEYIQSWKPATGVAPMDNPFELQGAVEISAPALSPEELEAAGKIKSASAKQALKSYEETEQKLGAAHRAKEKEFREKYIGLLEQCLKEATSSGNLDDAVAIRNAIKALKAGEQPPVDFVPPLAGEVNRGKK
ncbi:MAG: hypothetical protein K8T91_24695 [Planctomycetes bacterium]|nr:hypothetical protein [Planctomycetota bacterium]